MARKTATKEAEAVKKNAAKVAKAVSQTAASLRDLTEAELHKALQTAKEDLLMMRKMLKANELPSSHAIKAGKKKIAQIHTILTEREGSKNE